MRSLINSYLTKVSRLLILLICLGLSACATGYINAGLPPSDVCFTGIFSNGNISIQVIHDTGMVTASGWKEPVATVPWDYIYFNGSISRHGEARGEITLYFPEFTQLTVPDVTISLPDDRECNLRNSLTFSIAYTWEGLANGENYTLTRQP
jgi:hypothetical protein